MNLSPLSAPVCCGASAAPVEANVWICANCKSRFTFVLDCGRDPPHGGGEDPCAATQHTPGSEGKINVMMERARLRQSLFHELDSRNKQRIASGQIRPNSRTCASSGAETGSLPRGVSFDRQKHRYRARATVAGMRVYLGMFETIGEAERAIQRALADNR